MLTFDSVKMDLPSDTNIIIGQSHFIKTVEDVYEAIATTVPQAKFGLAFNESSGPRIAHGARIRFRLRSPDESSVRVELHVSIRSHVP